MPRPYARLLGKLTNAALRKVGLEVRRIDSEALAAERALRNYEASGRIPWSEGYHVAHARLIATALDDSRLMALFAAGQNLPGDYGIGIDERCVEIPWLFAKLRNISGGILDAGSALNYAYLIDRLLRDDRKLDIMTLAPEKPSFTHRGVGYLYEDLRNIPIVDEHYDCVACISTLEHIGFNNEAFTKRPAEAEHRPTDYLRACAEMLRVLRRGGRLLLTVPFGKYQDVGAFQQFSAREIGLLADSMKGAKIDIDYFKLRRTGAWDVATAEECAQCESVHWVMARENERPGAFPMQADQAASARAVACLDIVKG